MPSSLMGGAGTISGSAIMNGSGQGGLISPSEPRQFAINPVYPSPSARVPTANGGMITAGPRFYLSDEYSEAILNTSGIYAYWRLNETAGNVFADTLGRYDLNVVGGVTMAGRQGPTFAAVNAPIFDGTTGYAYGYPGNVTVLNGDYSVEFWSLITAVQTNGDIISTRNPGEYTLDIKIANATDYTADIGTGAAWLNTAAKATVKGNISGSVWYHVVYTVTGGNAYILINGALLATAALTAGTPAVWDSQHRLTVGAAAFLGEYFGGSIAELAIYNRAIDMLQIQNHYMIARGQQAASSTLVETFSSATMNASLWTSYTAGGAVINQNTTAPGALYIAPVNSAVSYAGYVSAARYDMSEAAIQLQVNSVINGHANGNGQSYFKVTDYVNGYQMLCDGDATGVLNLYCQRIISNGSVNVGSVVYSSAVHKWWRIREGVESDGIRRVIFEYSTNGYTWIRIAGENWQFPLTNVNVEIGGAMFVVDTAFTVGTFQVDNVGIDYQPVPNSLHPPQLPYLRM